MNFTWAAMKKSAILGLIVLAVACKKSSPSEVKSADGSLGQQLQTSGAGLARAKGEASQYNISGELIAAFQQAESALSAATSNPKQLEVSLYCGKLGLLRSKIARDTAMPIEKHVAIGNILSQSMPKACGTSSPVPAIPGSDSSRPNPWGSPAPAPHPRPGPSPW